MDSLKYICGKYIYCSVLENNMRLHNLPKSLIKFIQTLNPYICNNVIIKSRIELANELALDQSKDIELFALLNKYMAFKPNGYTFEYKNILLNASLNNNTGIVNELIKYRKHLISYSTVYDVINILRRFKARKNARYIHNICDEFTLGKTFMFKYATSYELCVADVQDDLNNFKHVPHDMITYSLCEYAVTENGLMLQYVPPHMITFDLCELAVNQTKDAFPFVPPHIKNDKMFCHNCVFENLEVLSYIDNDIILQELCEAVVLADGQALYYVPKRFKTASLCELAVSNNVLALGSVPYTLRTVELCKLAVSDNGLAIWHVPDDIITLELCEIAVSNDGLALEGIPDNLKTKEICELAIANNVLAYKHVPPHMKNTKKKYKF